MRQYITILIAALACAACSPTQQLVRHRTDTIRVETQVRDSIDRWHFVTTSQKGDTVYHTDSIIINRWHVRWRDSVRLVQDTVRQTIARTVERPLTTWQNLRLTLFWPLAVAVALLLLLLAYLAKK
ncbi:MAG: hypothetical protein IJR13_07845 [Bacteroidales bacterium]|nr:hypothetical protein [Bacteroidales bacterium]